MKTNETPTNKITIPACDCGYGAEFYVSDEDLRDAGGFIFCDYCGRPIKPAEADLNRVAVDVAMDEIRGTRLAWCPSGFISKLNETRNRILQGWAIDYQKELNTYEARP